MLATGCADWVAPVRSRPPGCGTQKIFCQVGTIRPGGPPNVLAADATLEGALRRGNRATLADKRDRLSLLAG